MVMCYLSISTKEQMTEKKMDVFVLLLPLCTILPYASFFLLFLFAGAVMLLCFICLQCLRLRHYFFSFVRKDSTFFFHAVLLLVHQKREKKAEQGVCIIYILLYISVVCLFEITHNKYPRTAARSHPPTDPTHLHTAKLHDSPGSTQQ